MLAIFIYEAAQSSGPHSGRREALLVMIAMMLTLAMLMMASRHDGDDDGGGPFSIGEKTLRGWRPQT